MTSSILQPGVINWWLSDSAFLISPGEKKKVENRNIKKDITERGAINFEVEIYRL